MSKFLTLGIEADFSHHPPGLTMPPSPWAESQEVSFFSAANTKKMKNKKNKAISPSFLDPTRFSMPQYFPPDIFWHLGQVAVCQVKAPMALPSEFYPNI